jgi:hypothetical protein
MPEISSNVNSFIFMPSIGAERDHDRGYCGGAVVDQGTNHVPGLTLGTATVRSHPKRSPVCRVGPRWSMLYAASYIALAFDQTSRRDML